jgi:hypothetical protein
MGSKRKRQTAGESPPQLAIFLETDNSYAPTGKRSSRAEALHALIRVQARTRM